MITQPQGEGSWLLSEPAVLFQKANVGGKKTFSVLFTSTPLQVKTRADCRISLFNLNNSLAGFESSKNVSQRLFLTTVP